MLAPGTAAKTTSMVFGVHDDWEPEGRPPLEAHQRPPTEPFDLWLLEAGRGAGKTEACSRYFTKYMRQHPRHRGRIIAPTYGDAVEACIEGPSGLKTIDPEIRWLPSAPGGSKVIWPNGSEALVLGTPFPKDIERLRAGGNRHLDWWEEMAANGQLGKAWDQAAFGLRLGDHPHSIASTTPRNTTEYRAIRSGGAERIVLTKASMFDNPYNPTRWVEAMRKKYEGTRLGRQELAGELLEDVEGALWSRRMIEACRVNEAVELVAIVVAVDPAATSKPDADDTGIIVFGLGVDGDGYVLADRTCHLNPDGWGQRVVRAYHHYQADGVIGETNNGGEMVEFVISTADPNVPYDGVHASRGKQTRAQPVASLYGQPPKRKPRIHHVGAFPELEDQLTSWVPGDEDSPDRLDALVWGATKLMLEYDETEETVEYYEPVKIGAQI